MVRVLNEAGFCACKPKGTFYCYVKAPTGTADGRRFGSAAAFSQFLIEKSLISTVPWDDAGAYIRISVAFEADGDEAEERVFEEIRSRLASLHLVF